MGRIKFERVLMLLAAIAATFAATTLYGLVRRARQAEDASACRGQLSALSAALAEYYHEAGHFPTQSSLDTEESLGALLAERISGNPFRCPSYKSSGARYFLITGPDTIINAQSPLTIEDVTDGIENTLVLIESTATSSSGEEPEVHLADIPLLLSTDGKLAPSDVHSSGRRLLFADGRIFLQKKSVSQDELRALMTPRGGEKLLRSSLVTDGVLVEGGRGTAVSAQ